MVKGFFFGFLCGLGFSPLIFQNCPLLCVLWRLVFIDKNIARFPNLIPQLLFFFCKFDFSYFFGFFLSTFLNEKNR